MKADGDGVRDRESATLSACQPALSRYVSAEAEYPMIPATPDR